MQYKQSVLVLLLLFTVPSVALAQDVSPAPVWVLSSALLLLLSLSIYVGLKIRQNFKKYIDKPAP